MSAKDDLNEWSDRTGLVCWDVPVNRFLVFDQRDKLWPKLLNPDAPTCTWYPDIDQVAFEIFE
jgi:hypothetical protein